MTSEVLEIDCIDSEIDLVIKTFLNEYELTGVPIEVSFRVLIPQLKKTDRYTHLIHTYPAKLLMHIPFFFLNNNIFSKPGDTVLDPFCGTGTVLLEALLAKRNALGADANPLARLIAGVKTRTYSTTLLTNTLKSLLTPPFSDGDLFNFPDVVNIDYWFNKKNKEALLVLYNRINGIAIQEIREFFLVCFSNLVKKVSNADPRVSVPVRLNAKRYIDGSTNFVKVEKRIKELESVDVFNKFESICKENIHRFNELKTAYSTQDISVEAQLISKDARNLTVSLDKNEKLPNESIDLIITSPPYAGAQKYIRSSSLNLGWLNLANSNELKYYDSLNIGRENYTNATQLLKKTNLTACDKLIEQVALINIKRALIVSNYIVEMQSAILESIRVLKKNGYFIMIVGNNKVCDLEFNTQEYLSEFMENNGLQLILKLIDDIKSYGLMTKRNKTADIISREWVLIFKKI